MKKRLFRFLVDVFQRRVLRMRAFSNSKQVFNRIGQVRIELVLFSVLLFALLLTLICLARRNGLRSLVGLTMRLAKNTA